MLTIANIPAEIYLVALDHMGVERPADPADARAAYDSAAARVDHEAITARQMGRDLGRLTAFGLALAQYVSLSGPFSEEDGEFAGLSGYEAR